MVYQVFRTQKEELNNNQEMQFFVSEKGTLLQIRFIEKVGMKWGWGGLSQEKEWDFKQLNEAKLIDIFSQFGLRDPQEFQNLYRALKKKKKSKVFACIEKARQNLIELFSFQ